MAITSTSTGSQWKFWSGTEEEIANLLMISGVGTANIVGMTSVGAAGSPTILVNWKI